MAEFRLQAGASIDILTQKELDHSLSSLAHDSVIERGRGVKWLRFPLLIGTLSGTFPTSTSSLGGPGKCGPNPGYAWAIRRISATGLGAGSSTQGASTTVFSTATTPAADGTIATTASLAAGVWTISWTVSLSGTLGAVDANNFTLELDSGPTTLENSINLAVAGTYAQGTVTVVVPAGGSTISVEAIALATTGAVYGAQIIATPAVTSTGADQLYVFRNEVVASQFICALSGQSATNFVGFTNVQAVLMNGDDLIIGPGSTFNASGVISVTCEGVEVPAEMLWKIA